MTAKWCNLQFDKMVLLFPQYLILIFSEYIYIYIYWRDWLKAPYFTGEYYGVLYLPISQFHNGSDV